MKISMLLQREPFESVFVLTLKSFLLQKTGTPHTVTWFRRFDRVSPLCNSQIWLCNPLINSIFVVGVNPEVFASVIGEYQKNPLKPWKSLLQAAYVKLAYSRLTAFLLANRRIQISPPIDFPLQKLILGGNNKIRLIDTKERSVYVLLKSGFNKEYMESEIFPRVNFEYLPIPKIKYISPDSDWYVEEYVVGRSPNRLEKRRGEDALFEAVSAIQCMLNETVRAVNVSNYLEVLNVKLKRETQKTKSLNVKTFDDMLKLAGKFSELVLRCGEREIDLAYCHGDFHQGNILADHERVWILDWEYSGERQIAYDLFVLLMGTRVESGFAQRFIRLLDDNVTTKEADIISKWPGLNWVKENKAVHLLLFLIEDLVFHACEKNNPMFYSNTDLHKARIREFEKIVEHVENKQIKMTCF